MRTIPFGISHFAFRILPPENLSAQPGGLLFFRRTLLLVLMPANTFAKIAILRVSWHVEAPSSVTKSAAILGSVAELSMRRLRVRFSIRTMLVVSLLISLALARLARVDFDRLAFDAVTRQDINTLRWIARIRPGAITINRYGNLLVASVWDGEIDIVREIAPLFSPQRFGAESNEMSASLASAIESRRIDLVELLLAQGANPNGGSGNAVPLVFDAIEFGDIELMKLLLAHKANPNLPNERGETPLVLAAKRRRFDMLELLLRHNADASKTASGGLSPLNAAMGENREDLVELLLAHGADPNQVQWFYLRSLEQNQPRMVELLVAYGADVNRTERHGDNFLVRSVKANRVELVELLLARGADPNIHDTHGGSCPLSIAVKQNNTAIVKLLLTHGANPNPWLFGTHTPLNQAVVEGRLDLVELLLLHGANPHPSPAVGAPSLNYAVLNNRPECAELLLKYGADPNRTNYDRRTPLIQAVEAQQADIVQILLNHAPIPISDRRPKDYPPSRLIGVPPSIARLMAGGVWENFPWRPPFR